MADYCPNPDGAPLPGSVRGRTEFYPGIGTCRYCRREYKLRANGLIRKHKSLPRRPSGGCPYTCDSSCDFACYGTKEDS